MRYAAVLTVATGCRAVFGLDPPTQQMLDAPGDSPVVDTGPIDGPQFGACTNDPNLIACFDFDGTLADQAPSPNALVAANIAYAPGQRGQAVRVGSASRIAINDSVLLDTSSYTIEAWIDLDAAPPALGRVGVWDVDMQYAMFIKDGGLLSCTTDTTLFDSGSITIGRWTHVACTSGSGVAIAYVDGKQVGQFLYSGTIPTAGTNGGEIGGNSPGGNDRLVGRIDLLRVYRTVRTPTEICADAACVP